MTKVAVRIRHGADFVDVIVRNAAPSPGDVLIARDRQRQPEAFLLSIVPSAPQMRYSNYDHAVAVATEWTNRHANNRMWFTDDGQTFKALDGKPTTRD